MRPKIMESNQMDVDMCNGHNDKDYFECYEDLAIHELMLRDEPRNQAYRDAILKNKDLFKDKIVLDVGSGTGILSIFCSQAGAKQVLAVEASNLAELSKKIIEENEITNISVFQTKIEEFQLPEGISAVDIIVSEWMGFYLLHEGMLDSVLYARDKFLSPEGLLFPQTAAIYLAPCSVPSRFDFWSDVDGVRMTRFAQSLRAQKSKEPEILEVSSENLLHEGTVVAWLDLKEIGAEDLEEVAFKEVIVSQRSGPFQGVCLWFKCFFPCSETENGEEICLSTSPDDPLTHWKQTVVVLPESACDEVEVGSPIAIELKMKRNPEVARRYLLELELLDPDKEEHSLPCDCIKTKCILTKAHLMALDANDL